ncbi:MAG: serine hydrolase domain-containing protein [Chlamydiia bacterium]
MKKILSNLFVPFFFGIFLSFGGLFAEKISEKPTKVQELTGEDLGPFLDGLIPLQLEQAHVAGAVVSVVKDGKLLFAKGYGYADVEKKIEINPETTLFRIASITKLFTWTAVMQQVELGKIDLDRDVNDYLDFSIPATFEKPITMRDIMTHRTGFEETIKEIGVRSSDDLKSLKSYLKTFMPKRIYPAGTIPAYSNYATGLAGYIVERVSGQKLEDYVEEHILKPLEMKNSSFQQLCVDSLEKSQSKGYTISPNELKTFTYIQPPAAGAIQSSAIDMTHFMIMQLQNGRYKNAEILNTKTAEEMHARQAGWPEGMNAMCLGFYELLENGHKVIAHGGDLPGFHSQLFLVLDANVGVFISYNSDGNPTMDMREYLLDAFMDRYFPKIPSRLAKWEGATTDLAKIAGTYQVSRRSETNLLALGTLLGEAVVKVDLEERTIYTEKEHQFKEIGPMLFQEVNGKRKTAFVKNPSGGYTMYIDFPAIVLEQVLSPLDRQGFNFSLLGFSLLISGFSLAGWPISALVRRHYNRPLSLNPTEKRLRTLGYVNSLGVFAFTVVVIQLISMISSDLTILSTQTDIWIHLLQVFGLLIGLGAIGSIYNAILSWRNRERWVWSKVWNTLMALAFSGFFWFLYHWHLFNFNLSY